MNIVGNAQNRTILNNVVKSNEVLHSYLFIGKDGIGKKLIAEEFAKKILCNNLSGDDNCKSCICYDSNNHPDFLIINEESNTIKIDEVRNLIEKTAQKPILSNKKVYIINDADKMTKEAQNCLLKTLEEPQDYTVIILIAENENKILRTIRSRCTRILFDTITNEEIEKILKNKFPEIKLTKNMLDFFGGSIGKALNTVNKTEIFEKIDDMISKIELKNELDFFYEAKKIFTKEEIKETLEYSVVSVYNTGRQNFKYLNCVYIIQDTINKLESNCNFDMCIDNMLWKLWEEVNEKHNRG